MILILNTDEVRRQIISRCAVEYGNIFSLDVGPDDNGKLRQIDVRTLRRVGEMIMN
jgi:hypothetical protein